MWDDEIGSLEIGKKADFVLFDLDHIEWTPFYDPLQALVFSASSASIVETWVDGKALYRDGRVQTVDEARDPPQGARACGRRGQAGRARSPGYSDHDSALRYRELTGRRHPPLPAGIEPKADITITRLRRNAASSVPCAMKTTMLPCK